MSHRELRGLSLPVVFLPAASTVLPARSMAGTERVRHTQLQERAIGEQRLAVIQSIGSFQRALSPPGEAPRVRLGRPVRHLAADPSDMPFVRKPHQDGTLLIGGAPAAIPDRILTIRKDHLSDRIRIDTADSGPGIPREESARIWDKFHQTDQRPARSRGGCGLGLTTARKFAVAEDGRLSFAPPTPGAGGRFSVTLPAGVDGNSRRRAS